MTLSKYMGLVSGVISCFLFSHSANAQLSSFIHVQSENNKAYYVQWKGNTYSSSATGYLVIPQVPPGDHTLVFGFQNASLPEYSFSVSIADKPRGFSLKQSVNNTWSLFDMVSFAVTKGSVHSRQKENKPELVMNAPDEPAKKPEPVKDTVAGPLPVHVIHVEEPAVNKALQSREAPIQKIFDKAGTAGIDQVYVIVTKGKADTVALFIPALKEEEPVKQSAYVKPGNKTVPILCLADPVMLPADLNRTKYFIK